MKKVKLSVCIPTYEMQGRAKAMLIRAFNSLKSQSFHDFEVIVSDNSEDDVVKNLCADKEYESLNIKYFKNDKKGLSPNLNFAMTHAKGDIIKIIHMDDYLANPDSLKDIVENFKGGWLVTGCGHDRGDGKIIRPHFPKYNSKIYLERNTIGSPSVLTIENKDILLCDDKLTWLNDCDYYKRLYDRYGEPTILNKINVVIGIGDHQTTNKLTDKHKRSERIYLREKYHDKNIIRDWLFEIKKKLQTLIN